MPLALNRFAGITLFGNGVLFNGSRIVTTLRKNGFEAFNNSLKSPVRIAAEGTIADPVFSCRNEIHSSDTKKNTFSLFVLNSFGMNTGPPTENPCWLNRNGAGRVESNVFAALRTHVFASSAEFLKNSHAVP